MLPQAVYHRARRQGMNYSDRFKVHPGNKGKLQEVDSAYTDRHSNRKDADAEIEEYRTRLRELQEVLYADRRCSILICLQALDSGGKDGTIDHVGGALNPQGCHVVAFKQPTPEE